MTRRRLVPLALAAAVACATAPEPAGPPPFEGVKSVALVRWRDGGSTRPRDPLDALKESLDARGYRTRVVDVGHRVPDELRPVQRLHERMGTRGRTGGRAGRGRVERVGREARDAVRALGVDAVALYHRLEDWTSSPAYSDPGAFRPPGTLPPSAFRRPLGALSLVDAEGAAVSFEWGAPGGAAGDPSMPLNAAEAIDALLRVLSGGDEESYEES
jgi:hypothetical protein